jgi:hypothetical protein
VADTKPGWYPNPDGSTNQRRWDGKDWTEETRPYPPPIASNHSAEVSEPGSLKAGVTPGRGKVASFIGGLPKWVIFVASGVAIVIVVLAIAIPASSFGKTTVQATPTKSVAPRSYITPLAIPVVPKITPTPIGPVIVPLGSPVVSPNYSLVIDSVEVLDQIETTSGGPIVADPGTQLVLVHSTITVTGNAIDLTCASAGAIFIEASDSNNSKMANIFEGPRIPGNPQCNYKTSAGETVAWNFAYKIAAGRTPAFLSIIDTDIDGNNTWGKPIVASLQ